MSTEARPARAPRPRRILLKLCLSTLGALVLLELGLRVLLFSDLAAGTIVAASLREPGRWSHSSDDLYWKLVHLWRTSEAPSYMPPHDDRLGWTWWNIAAGTYRHIEEVNRGQRRPVLLFGDSYSACLTSKSDCFEGLFSRSRLAEDFALLNYGVCGYGFDQIYLMLDAALDHHLGNKPIVIMTVLVDDNLNRTLLSLREYPKPRLRVVDGQLVEPRTPVPTTEEFFSNLSGMPASWSWALANGLVASDPAGLVDTPERREMDQISRLLVRAIVTRLRASEVEFFFVLFHTINAFDESRPEDWRQTLLREELDALEAPWYDVRPEIRSRAAANQNELADYFLSPGELGAGHYNAAGNLAAFDVMRRGLRDVAAIDALESGAPPAWRFRVQGEMPPGGLATFGREAPGPTTRVKDTTRLLLRGGPQAELRVVYQLDRQSQLFRATAWVFDPEEVDRDLSVTAEVDGVPVWSQRLRPSMEPMVLEIDLTSAQTLEWVLAARSSQACLVLSDPLIE